MAKEHDSWMSGIGVEIGKDDQSVTVAGKDGGGSVTYKYELKKDTPAAKFAIGPIPAYLKGFVRIALEGSVEATRDAAGKVKVSGGVNGTVAGGAELGLGHADPNITFGPYGSLELSATQGVNVTYDQAKPEGQRWELVTPLTIFIKATGKVGAKIEVKGQASFNVEAASSSWELYIVTLGGWNGKAFTQVDIREGKDMVLLKQTLAKPGPAIQAAVEKYAPDSVKKAAEDGARWAIEDPGAGKVADVVAVGMDQVKQTTGVDAGARVEDAVAYLVSDDQETSTQTTQRIERTSAMLNATGEQFAAVMSELELWPDQALGRFRKAAEWNAVQALLDADRKALEAGNEPSGAWVDAANALAATARGRKKAQEQAQREQQKAQADDQARQLAEEARRAVEQMMAVRLQAMSPGNHLDSKTKANPAAVKARKYWETGMQQYWTPAELQRLKLDSLPPQPRRDKAYQLIGLYQNAQKVFQAGVQQL
ncbi:MAG: hypothetical protein ACKVQR_11765 [Aquabacterium sp.]